MFTPWPSMKSGAPLILLGCLALVILAWASGLRIEASHLDIVSSDTLYIPLLAEGSPFSFRTSTASNLFPEGVYYAAVQALGVQPIDGLLIAGILQCSITTLFLARFSGQAVALAYNVLYFAFGFPYYFAISFHQGLIVMTVLYLAGANPIVRRAMSLVFTMADPLFGLVPALFLMARACMEKSFDTVEAWLVLLGFCGAFYLCESNGDVAKFAPLLVGCLLAGWLATLRRVRPFLQGLQEKLRRSPIGRLLPAVGGDEYRLCSAFLLLAAVIAALGGQPSRYVLPFLIASMVFHRSGGAELGALPKRGWIAAALLGVTSFAASSAFVQPALAASSRTGLAQFECLATHLRAMQVDAVATDFWTFKPLYFVQAGSSGVRLMQLDFRDGSPDTHINDHRFVRGQAHFIVKNPTHCNPIGGDTRSWAAHCSEDWYARLGVKARSEVCNGFAIIETERAIDFTPWGGVFKTKRSAFVYNFQQNFGRLRSYF